MNAFYDDSNRRHGFTLIELMIVVAIIGLLSSVAIPNFFAFQKRSKTSEVKSNLAALAVSQEAYYSSEDTYRAAPPEPAVIPGALAATFNPVSVGFDQLGWTPEGNVYFSYAVAVSGDGTGYTADAAADVDADGFIQSWGYVNPSVTGVLVPGQLGCNAAFPTPLEIGGCDPQSGQSVF